ncbi:MAG: hypothetical protein IPO21_14235 [Bacteroidales bacterium]|nr:hypothetical protein [Bacteroidales bacterium]
MHSKISTQQVLLLAITILCFSYACETTIPLPNENTDFTAGIYGKVEVFNEYGEKESSQEGVEVIADCYEILGYSEEDSSTISRTTNYLSRTNAEGYFNFTEVPTGSYTLTFISPEHGVLKISNYSHDYTRADTIKDIYLAKKPLGSIKINSIRKDETKKMLIVNRTISFTGMTDKAYGMVTRYFFHFTPDVSDKVFSYTTTSGASKSTGGNNSTHDIFLSAKPLELLDTLKNETKIYVAAYLDNYKSTYYIEFDDMNDSIMKFPNLTLPSNVVVFDKDTLQKY